MILKEKEKKFENVFDLSVTVTFSIIHAHSCIVQHTVYVEYSTKSLIVVKYCPLVP